MLPPPTTFTTCIEWSTREETLTRQVNTRHGKCCPSSSSNVIIIIIIQQHPPPTTEESGTFLSGPCSLKSRTSERWDEMSGWCNRRSYKLVHSERVVGSQLRIRLLCFLLCHQGGFLSAQGSGIRWIQFFSCCVCFLAVSFVGWIGYLGLEVGFWLPTCMYTLVKRLNLNYIQLRLCVSIVTWEVRRRRINNSS